MSMIESKWTLFDICVGKDLHDVFLPANTIVLNLAVYPEITANSRFDFSHLLKAANISMTFIPIILETVPFYYLIMRCFYSNQYILD